MLRFNHMELTLPPGELDKHRKEISDFYGELLGFEALDVPIMGQTGLLLRTDPDTSQFILLMEMEKHLRNPGYDHLGFLLDTREQVDDLLAECKRRQASDPRIKIQEYEDLIQGGVTVHAFYVQFILPLWFDIQSQEFDKDATPKKQWRFS